HPDTALSYTNVAHRLRQPRKPAATLLLSLKALDTRRQVLGEQHPDTSATYGGMAVCLESQGKHAEAVGVWEKAILGHEFGRLQGNATGFDRSLFRAGYVPPPLQLAATLVRLSQPIKAWEHAEAELARGLLEDMLRSDASAGDAGRL